MGKIHEGRVFAITGTLSMPRKKVIMEGLVRINARFDRPTLKRWA